MLFTNVYLLNQIVYHHVYFNLFEIHEIIKLSLHEIKVKRLFKYDITSSLIA